jgi:hypothetical protein
MLKNRVFWNRLLVHIQNVDLQNVESQNVELQNVESQNIDKTKRRHYKTSTWSKLKFYTEMKEKIREKYDKNTAPLSIPN